jgi:hypothetical protein
MIDRRFYRRKNDAAKTLETFSATLRNVVDLKQPRKDLIAVVTETMQPSYVSLWLRPPSSASKQQRLGTACLLCCLPVGTKGSGPENHHLCSASITFPPHAILQAKQETLQIACTKKQKGPIMNWPVKP